MTRADVRGVALETARLELRLPEKHELSEVVAFYARNRAHLAPWDPPRPDGFETVAYWDAAIRRNEDQQLVGQAYRFFLFLREPRALFPREGSPPRLVGTVALTNVLRGPLQAATLGFSVDAAVEGTGVMREAVERVVAFAFDELGLHRIEANHQPQNLRSAALLRRVGFEVQGYARDYLFVGGAWRDHVLTARRSPHPVTPR